MGQCDDSKVSLLQQWLPLANSEPKLIILKYVEAEWMIQSKIIDREVSTVIMIILIVNFEQGNQFRMRRDSLETLRLYSVRGSIWSCENQSGRYCDWNSNGCWHGLFYSQIDPVTRKRFVFQQRRRTTNTIMNTTRWRRR